MAELAEIWDRPMQALVCDNCQKRYLAPASDKSFVCPDCPGVKLTLSADVLDDSNLLQPELVVPFSVSAETISQSAQEFVEKYRFTPADLTAANLQSRMQKLFLPMYLVDSAIAATWQSDIGFEAHAAPYGRQSDTTWEARAGRIERHYDNVRTPALADHSERISSLGKFKFWHAGVYEANQVDGALIRLPDQSTDNAWPEAKQNLLVRVAHDCALASGGRYTRDFSCNAEFANVHWTKLLLPVYTTWYAEDDGTPVTLMVNGDSGRIIGRNTASTKQALRTALIIALAAILLFALYLVGFYSATTGISALLLPFAVVVAMATLLPLLYAFTINRQS